mgnify:FL=1
MLNRRRVLIADAVSFAVGSVAAIGMTYATRSDVVREPSPVGPPAAVVALSSMQYMLAGPIGHRMLGLRRQAWWSMALRLAVPNASAMLADGIALRGNQPLPPTGLALGAVFGALLAVILDATVVRRPDFLASRARLGLGLLIGLLASVALAVFVPRWDAYLEARDSVL